MYHHTYLVVCNFTSVPTKGNSYAFTDEPLLHNMLTVSIEVITATQLTQDLNGNPIITQAQALAFGLTLQRNAKQSVTQKPLAQLIKQLNGGIMAEFDFLQVDYQKSQINCFTSGVGVSALDSVCLDIGYIDPTGPDGKITTQSTETAIRRYLDHRKDFV